MGILAGVGSSFLSNLNDSVLENKLSAEVATLNSAAATYLGFGGNFDDVTKPEDALSKLRSVAHSDIASRIPGLSSSMVDRRIAAVVTSEDNVDSGEARVVWNSTKNTFETATKGEGITAFFLNPDDAEIERSVDERDFAFLYSGTDSWVWDFTEVAAAAPQGPSQFTTYNSITIVTNPPPPSSQNPDPEPETTPLGVPVFSTPSGDYAIRDFDLGITLTIPNESGTSEIYYQINYGNWEKYITGSIFEIEPDTQVATQAISTSELFSDSNREEATFSATPVQLNPPAINPSSESFGVLANRLIAVVLEDTNGDDPSAMQYRIGNGAWNDYLNFLLLDRVDFESGAVINSRAISEDPYFLNSDTELSVLTAEEFDLAGLANGLFHNPSGGSGMETNLPYGSSQSDYFEWGRITNYYGNPYSGFSKSSLEFEGSEVEGIAFDDRFLIGNIDYYNGRFLSNTGADAVDLSLDLAFDIGGTTYNTAFDYEFELVNTINDNNDIEGWASADYVRMDRSNSATEFEIAGLTFELVLEFGETTADGFSNFDEFHVRENNGATSNLYATLKNTTQSQGNVGSDGTAIEDPPSGGSEEGSGGGGLLSGILDFLSGFGGMTQLQTTQPRAHLQLPLQLQLQLQLRIQIQ